MKNYFVTGIGTNIGKTICSAILVEFLKADYWKPIQSGDLDNSDSKKIYDLISNTKSKIFPEQFQLTQPLSPHASAEIDGVSISLEDFILPESENNLIIEGAGGLMVPINNQGDLIVDLIRHLNAEVILISQNYLGSINHTLLSLEVLKSRNIPVKGVLFNGEATQSSEEIILEISEVKNLGRIDFVDFVSKSFVRSQVENLNWY